MNLRLATLVLLAALAGASATAAPARPATDACKLLKAALRGTIIGASAVNRARGSNRVNCEYEDNPPGPDRHWWAHLNGLLPERSIATAKADWQRNWQGWKGTTGDGVSVFRLRGFGADDAFAVENLESNPPSSNTLIWWRKGRHYGLLEIGGLGNLADVEEAEQMLKEIMPGVPRT